jgi:serine/threonine-protein kinase
MEFCPRDGARLTAPVSDTEAQLPWGVARRFRIVRRLGAGCMGTVFLAEQLAVGNRPVALKVLNPKLLDDPEFLLRFQNEAASTGRIHHPNVVTIYESGQADDGTPYIAMEYLEGETLSHALKARGALPVAECAEILQQAARGLNAAHKLGIIHRDLKPDNIFLTRGEDESVREGSVLPLGERGRGEAAPHPYNELVKVLDFGIAKLRESATHTLTGTVLGTPAYMSYEQASGMKSDELDARSAIYSLGVVAYEMLTGHLPFQSGTPVGYLRKHLQEAPPPFHEANPNLPALAQVESVVMKALSKDRDKRYGSALEFAQAFADATNAVVGAVREPPLRGQGTMVQPRAVPPARPVVSTSIGQVPTTWRLAVWVGVLTGALLLAFGGWYLSLYVHWRSGPQTQGVPSSTPQKTAPTGAGTVAVQPKGRHKYSLENPYLVESPK